MVDISDLMDDETDLDDIEFDTGEVFINFEGKLVKLSGLPEGVF